MSGMQSLFGSYEALIQIESFHKSTTTAVQFILKDGIKADLSFKELLKQVFKQVDTNIKSEGWSDECIVPAGCPDCTDGFYYPLVGPREACQTCSTKPDFDTFVQEVSP